MNSLQKFDKILPVILPATTLASIAILFLIIAFVALESLPALNQVGFIKFFTDASWHPQNDLFNINPMLVGSLFVTLGAVIIAAPIAVFSAVFLIFYAPAPLAFALRRLIEIAAGIPSVVYGLWGLVSLVPLINILHPPGQSLLAAILVLALMIVPTITLFVDAALRKLDRTWLQGALALGLSRSSIIRKLAIPAAGPGIYTGIVLGLARALGETMAVVMVSGNVVQFPGGLFTSFRTLTANIALEMAYATDHHRSALFVTGLALLVLILGFTLLGEKISQRKNHA